MNTCTICLEYILNNDYAKKEYFLCDCYMNFHNHCLVIWCDKSLTCPICRSAMNISSVYKKRTFCLLSINVVCTISLFILCIYTYSKV